MTPSDSSLRAICRVEEPGFSSTVFCGEERCGCMGAKTRYPSAMAPTTAQRNANLTSAFIGLFGWRSALRRAGLHVSLKDHDRGHLVHLTFALQAIQAGFIEHAIGLGTGEALVEDGDGKLEFRPQ